MKILNTLTLLLASTMIFAQNFDQLDGSITEDESYSEVVTNEKFKLMVRYEGQYIYVNIKSEPLYVASLCINDGNEVRVLHASSALGMITYKKNNNQWMTNEKFNWEMRDVGMGKSIIDARKAYFAKYGWVANTMAMGEPGETEFIIKAALVNNQDAFQLAAGLMRASRPDEIVSIPEGLEAGCANAVLVSGDPKTEYDFLPRGWYKIELER